MKKIRSYTSIWNVEKILYGISDVQLPFPVTFTQIAWFISALMFVVLFADVPPLSFIDGALLKYVAIPIGVAWFASRKTFDGKKPFSFLKSVILYISRPKLTYAYKPVKVKNQRINEEITIVRSDLYVPD